MSEKSILCAFICFSGRFGDSYRTGEREIRSVNERVPDNPIRESWHMDFTSKYAVTKDLSLHDINQLISLIQFNLMFSSVFVRALPNFIGLT